jgi:hypothetical protein
MSNFLAVPGSWFFFLFPLVSLLCYRQFSSDSQLQEEVRSYKSAYAGGYGSGMSLV